MEEQKCIVCGTSLESEEPQTLVLDGITKHTATPLREVVGSALQQKLKSTDHICAKCFDLFNEKDKLQKMTTDMESHIMTKIKDSSRKVTDTKCSISIVVGEPFSSKKIREEIETQCQNLKVAQFVSSLPEEADPQVVTTKKRRGRPPKLNKRKVSKEDKVPEPPPLMVTHREKRKRSARFNTFLEVLKGEKEFYIEDEDVEEPKTYKRRGGGRKKKVSVPEIFFPAEEEAKGDDVEKMCIIQVTDPDMDEGVSHITEKDRLDLDEVVQEILGIDPEDSLIHGIEALEHDDKALIDVIDEMNSHQQLDGNSCLKKSAVLPNHKLIREDSYINAINEINSKYKEKSETDVRVQKTPDQSTKSAIQIKEEISDVQIKEEMLENNTTDWPNIPTDRQQVFENLNTPSIEVTEIEEDLAASMPSLEVTITQSEDNTLRAVVNDPDVLSAIVQEDLTDALVSAIKQKDESEITESDQRKYRCKLCSIIFLSKEDARKHAQLCRTILEDPENDAKHTGNSHKSYKCFNCNRVFPTARGRDRHHLHMHLKNKPVQCLECSRTFNSFRPLERHLRNYHDKDPTLFCNMCEAEFVLGTSLEHHKEIVHPVAAKTKVVKLPSTARVREPVKPNRKFECPFCHEEIYGARALRIHHQQVHDGQEYTCKYCKYKCACLSTMHRHMVRVHKALNLKLYSCFKCSAGYEDPRDLEEHYISVHDAETSHLCQHCGDKFACLDMLRFHRKSHRAFSCKLCYLGFMKEEALEDHMNTVHTCDPVRSENADVNIQTENESVGERLGQTDEDTDGNDKDSNVSASSKVLVVASDGTVQVKEEAKEASIVPVPSEDVTLHLQQSREGGLEEMDMLNPLKGQKVKDLPKKMNCPICNKVLTTKFLRTHMLSHKGNLPHKCHMCNKAYAQGTLLRKHMKNRHYEEFLKLGNKNPKKHKIACEFCPNIYDNIYTLEEHLWQHMSEKIYECTDCKIKFGMRRNLREHYKSHFFKEAQPCPVCKREFKSIGFYNEHVERCQKRWKCELCDMECETQEYYRKHQRAEHGGENVMRYKCSLCVKSFVERFRYDDHMITHSSEKAFICHICSKQFKRQRPLNDHLIRAHSDGGTRCGLCHKPFATQQELEEHKRKYHRKEYVCTSCGHVYFSRETLANHITVHHSEARSHPCPICGQSFVKQYNLKAHLITHSSNTPHICHANGCHKMFRSEALLRNHADRRHSDIQFDCPLCDRRFGLESDQIRHMATHLNGASLPCSECGRTYQNEAQLERHMMTHTHEKPYECGVCQHTATTRNQLLRHLQGAHGIMEGAPHLVVNRWRCSVCGKMFVLRGSLLRHLEDHTTQGIEAQGHPVKTRSTSSMISEVSVTSGTSDPATATNSFLEQVSSLSWQDLTPLLRLHVVADEESGEGGTAAVATDVWQCPGCLHATQTEDEMRDHLVVTSLCQEAVILHLADGLANTDDLDGEGTTEEQLLNDDGSGTVLQLTGSDGGMQYVIVQEEDGLTRLNGGNKENQSVQERDGGMQVLVSMDDSIQHLLGQQPAHSDIQIVVEDSAPLKQLLAESEGGEENPSQVTGATSPNGSGQSNVASNTPILNGSEVLLQTTDGRLVLQQIVGGVTQYQLVEGVATSGEDDENSAQIQLVEGVSTGGEEEEDVIAEALIPPHPTTLHPEFMLP